MLTAATWGVLIGKPPGAYSKQSGIWDIGERVVSAIGQTAPQCLISDLVATTSGTLYGGYEDQPGWQRPKLWPPVSLVNQTIVGGIAMALLEAAHGNILDRAHGKHTAPDVHAIGQHALAGVTAGKAALIVAIDEGISGLKALRGALAK